MRYFWLFVVCLLPPSAANITELVGMFGQLQSPNYPEGYPSDADVTWNITVPTGYRIQLYFMHFDLEPSYLCEYDFVKVTSGDMLETFCGRESTDTEKIPGQDSVLSSDNTMTVLFKTDFSNEERFTGFEAHYAAIDIDECVETLDESLACDHFCHNYIGGFYCSCRFSYILHSDNRTCKGNPCPVVQPPLNGKVEPILEQYSFKDQVQIRCNTGFKFVKGGDEVEAYQIECLKSGTWSSGIPTCKVIDCGTPRLLEDGFITFHSKDNLTLFGSQIDYSCHALFYQMEPELNSTYTCMENSFWVNDELGTDLPTCHPVCGKPVRSLPPLNKRIIGGRTAHPGVFPWQLLMVVEDVTRVPKDKWFGSGALLSGKWVLTAAHVLRSQRRDNSITLVLSEYVTIYLGLHDVRQKKDAVKRSVEKIILHKAFDPRTYNNDIALVKMKEKVSMNAFVMPLCLPSLLQEMEGPSPNTLGLVAGWGITNSNLTMEDGFGSDQAALSNILQYVKLPVTLQAECRSSYESRSDSYNVTDNMFCAGFYEGGRDTCLGDSGGAFITFEPVTARWVAQGLVSWGGPEKCGSKRVYGVYTKISKYAKWLKEKMNNSSE
ncbi:mannan-binding lectin serine protease 1 isoform X8 [Narcine bancroftii]|uniref:mannan-binding lectin serine protease 1 isoform X8 n=1 Tax=Narcine bancroftii TaxID=1343680 RepID=UPI0038316BEB